MPAASTRPAAVHQHAEAAEVEDEEISSVTPVSLHHAGLRHDALLPGFGLALEVVVLLLPRRAIIVDSAP
jgi:hypothetical protein